MKLVFLLVIVCVITLHGLLPPVFAAKKRVRALRAPRLVYSLVRLSRPTHSVVVSFLNLNKIAKISYSLRYNSNGIPQGVVGSIVPSGQITDSRDLYFGTCSKGVCTPHGTIQNASLTVTAQLIGGGTFVKRYVVKF